jgi:DNA primase
VKRSPESGRSGSGGVDGQLLERVRDRSRIVDLFDGQALRKAGRDFLTTCPWHDDRRPSLTVSPSRNRVHCFVCNRGLDPIGWLQDRHGLSFPQAVEELARRYAIPLPEEDPAAAARRREEQLERQQKLQWRQQLRAQFHQELVADLERNGPAARYLQQRGLSRETAIDWQLGLHQQRLMLPITDRQGRCCGFSGRALAAQEPKYLNSGADALFRKRELLFGLEQAASAISKERWALLVEGPLDVLQLHQAGLPQAVAALGTALSEEQRLALQRCGMQRLVIAFDADPAGTNATARLLKELRPRLSQGELQAAVLELPAGEDADSLVRRSGLAGLQELLQRAPHWLDWELTRLLRPLQSNEAPPALAQLEQLQREGQALVAELPGGVLKQRAQQRLHSALAAATLADRHKGESHGGDPHGDPIAAVRLPPARTPQERLERRALRLYLHAPHCRELLAALELQDPICKAALDWAVQLNAAVPPERLADALVAITPELAPDTAALLLHCAKPGEGVIQVLQQEALVELEAVLNGLEPLPEAPPATPAVAIPPPQGP